MAMDLQGGLSFAVDGPGGSTSGTVTGDGAVLRVRTEDPVAALGGVLGPVPTGTAVLGAVADVLAEQGLAVELTGPDGLLALVGAGADSGVGRVLTGSRRVQLGRTAALRPIAVAQVRRTLAALTPVTPVTRGAAAAGVSALLLTVLRRRLRA